MTLRTVRSLSRRIGLLITIALFACSPSSLAAEPASGAKVCLDKLGSMPDYCQTNEKHGELLGDGGNLCGPTSLSNSLIWLAKNGHPRLVSGPVRAEKTQFELIQTLSAPETAGVDLSQGIRPLDLMRVLDRYAAKCGYKAKIQWKGRANGGPYAAGKTPDEAWITEGVRGNSNVVLQMGFYNLNAQTGLYTRFAGHWVTVAGYDLRNDKVHKLILHDPSARTGVKPRNEICTVVPITTGTLAKWGTVPERPAAGHLILQGIAVKKGAQVGIIDGALRFTLEEKTPTTRPGQ